MLMGMDKTWMGAVLEEEMMNELADLMSDELSGFNMLINLLLLFSFSFFQGIVFR